jgi:hypothetical protein
MVSSAYLITPTSPCTHFLRQTLHPEIENVANSSEFLTSRAASSATGTSKGVT